MMKRKMSMKKRIKRRMTRIQFLLVKWNVAGVDGVLFTTVII